MKPILLSVSGASLQGMGDRRTITKALAGVPPDGKVAGRPVWSLASIFGALSGGARAEHEVRDLRVRRERLALAKADGSVIDLDEAYAILDQVIGFVRAELDGLPARVTRDRDIRTAIEKAVTDLLTRIADKCDHAATKAERVAK